MVDMLAMKCVVGVAYAELKEDIAALRNANILFWRNQGISIKTLATSNHLTQGRICQIISQEKKNVIKGKQKMIRSRMVK